MTDENHGTPLSGQPAAWGIPGIKPLEALFTDPTGCYVQACSKENQIMLHVQDDPAGLLDLCWAHAITVAAACAVMRTCACAICRGARLRIVRVQRILDGEVPFEELDVEDQEMVSDQDLRLAAAVTGHDFAAEARAVPDPSEVGPEVVPETSLELRHDEGRADPNSDRRKR